MQQKHAEQGARAGENGAGTYTQLQGLLERGAQVDAARSLGERLAPYLLALVEACWFNGILIGLAGVDFLHTNVALLPFWGPPLLLCSALWLFRRVLRIEANAEEGATEEEQGTHASRSGLGLLFGLLALLDVGLIWLRLYAGTNFLLDPRWLLAFGNDLLSLNDKCYQALMIVIITVYFCWRATRLGQVLIEPAQVWRQLWVGLLVLLAAILLRAGQASGSLDDLVLVLLIPAFLYFALSAHALARISFVRRMHPAGLDGSAEGQERAVLSVVGGVGLVLLGLTLLGAVFFSAAFFNSLQPTWRAMVSAYDWLMNGLALLLSWILYPLFALLPQITPHSTPGKATGAIPKIPLRGHQGVSTIPPGLVFAAELLLPFLILLAVVLVLWIALRRRKRLRIRRNRASGDVHESIWSWTLFWRQFKAFWAALLRRKGNAEGETESGESLDNLPAEPAARTIREIYRALLKRAALFGYARKRNETPREFQSRLNSQLTRDNEPQLSQLTEAYTLTRYGGSVPDEYDVTRMRSSWEILEKKWQAPS
jgi:hypothetical protein